MVNPVTKAQNGTDERSGTVTTADIALAAGVSTATVSYVLSGREGVRVSEQTRERVRNAAAHLGYRRNSLASALRTGKTRTVGIVSTHMSMLKSSAVSRHNYVKDLMLATCLASSRAGLNAVMLVDKPLDALPVHEVTDRRVDGLILFGLYDADDWVRGVLQTGIPCVEINSSYGAYQVHTDNAGGARLAVHHLVGLGHRRIVHLSGAPSILSARQRERGFWEAAHTAGVRRQDMFVVSDLDELTDLMQDAKPPTGLFSFNDENACLAIDRMESLGVRVPADLSIVGFDNSLHSEVVRPRLTTVQNPLDALASAAVTLLRMQIDGKKPDVTVRTVRTDLIVRDSSAPPLS